MTRDDFAAAVNSFAGMFSVTLVPAGPDGFELRAADVETARRTFVRGHFEQDSLAAISLRCLCGAIEDRSGLLGILTRNFGGVMGTPFWFSVREMQSRYFLFLETRESVDPAYDTGEIVDILGSWWVEPRMSTISPVS